FRLFLWEQDHYVELNNPKLSPFQSIMGTGFFALTRTGANLTLSSPDVFQNAVGPERVVVLEPGWNIVSQPWKTGPTFTMLYSNLQATQDRALAAINRVAASLGTLVSPLPIELVGGKYVTSNTMTAGRAYWILN